MKQISLEQKVVSLRLPSYEESSGESGTEKVLEITMQIKKVPKLSTIQRVKDAKQQATKTVKTNKRQSEIIESSPKIDIMMAPKLSIKSRPKGGREKIDGIKGVTNSFMYFNKSEGPKLRDKNPDLKLSEIGRLAGQNWRNLTDNQKKPYQDLADQDKERYLKEKELHEQTKNSQTPVAKTIQQKMPSSQSIKKVLSSQVSKSTAATNSQKSNVQTKNLSLSPPKVQDSDSKKLTSYQIFMSKSSADFQAKNPSASPLELRKLKNAHWGTLNKEQKDQWSNIQSSQFGNDLTQTKMSPPSFGKVEKKPVQANTTSKPANTTSKPVKNKIGRVTGYNVFFRQTSSKIRAEQPTLTNSEISKVVGETWGLVSAEVKKKYDIMANNENQLKNQKSAVQDNEETFSENN